MGEQLRINAAGILAASVAVPFVMAPWTPATVSVVWGVGYALTSLLFILGYGFRQSQWVLFVASVTSGVFIAFVPLSVLVWGMGDPSAPWIASLVGFIAIGFDIATGPFQRIPLWQLPVGFIGLSVALVVTAETNLAVGAVIGVLIVGMLAITGRNRTKTLELDARLAEAEQQLMTDSLTGLLNRQGLAKELTAMDGSSATVALFNVDHFKLVNDTHGGEVGDEALQAIAQHLCKVLGHPWKLARRGGDEFVAVAPGPRPVNVAIADPIPVGFSESAGWLTLSLTAGVATGTPESAGGKLLSEAGYALRHARNSGQKLVDSEGPLRERFLRTAAVTDLDADRIVPVAQLICDDSGSVGCEVLARWTDDDGQLLGPDHFLDVLAENGLMARLDDVMVSHAADLARRLKNFGVDAFVSVNITASRLLDPNVAVMIEEAVVSHGIEPDRLMIEVTESEQLSIDHRWEKAVQQLRGLGVLFAIDDFGAGYSSIERLQRLPVTHLKLDRSLVGATSGPLGEVVKGVTRFCASSGITVIGEGIETADELNAMRQAEVTLYQGYLFGHPEPVNDFLRTTSGAVRNARGKLSPQVPEQPAASAGRAASAPPLHS